MKITLTILCLFCTANITLAQSAEEYYLQSETAQKKGKYSEAIINAEKAKSQLGNTNPKIESLLVMAYFNNRDIVNAKIAYETLMKITPSSKKQSANFQSYVDIGKQIDDALAKAQATFLEEVKSQKIAGEKEAEEILQAYEKDYSSKKKMLTERFPEKKLYKKSIELDRVEEYLQFKNSFNLKTSEEELIERQKQKKEHEEISSTNLYGYINLYELVNSSPEYKSIVLKLEELQKIETSIIKLKNIELTEKLDKYRKEEPSKTEEENELRGNEIRDIQQDIQEYSTTAYTELQRKQTELIDSLMEKIKIIIQRVANKKNIYTVIDSSNIEDVLIIGDIDSLMKNAYNLMNDVKKELGIK